MKNVFALSIKRVKQGVVKYENCANIGAALHKK